MHDKSKPDEQLFAETGDWSAMAEELALQLNADASHLSKKYSAPNVSDLAERINAKISSEQDIASQPVSLHVVNDEVSDEQAPEVEPTSDELHVAAENGSRSSDRADSLEWLKIAAAAMLFLAVTASTIWYSSRLTLNPTFSVANDNVKAAPQKPITPSQSAPLIANAPGNNHEPVNVVSPPRGTQFSKNALPTKDFPIERNLHIGEVSFDPTAQASPPKQKIGSEAEMLRIQLSAYEHVIQSMQREIADLRREMAGVRKELADQKPPANSK